MKDAQLHPAGTKRCSRPRFGMWLGLLGLIVLWGIWACALVFAQGLGATGMDNLFGLGLWMTFDLAIIALGGGAFFCSFLYYVLGIPALKNVTGLAATLGLACLAGAMALFVVHIGQPLRIWFAYWHPNVHSMLTVVTVSMTIYLIIVGIEFIPLLLTNHTLQRSSFSRHLARNFHLHMPLFILAGTVLFILHQGSLGGLFGVLFGRPFVWREGVFIWPWTFFLFTLSAIASGPVFLLLISSCMEKATGRRLVDRQTKSLLGKVSGLLLAIYVFFKILDTWAWAQGILPRTGMSFQDMYHQMYSLWLLWAEIGVCGVLPAIMLVIPGIRQRSGLLHLAAVLTCAGVILNRFSVTVHNLAIPVLPFEQWAAYVPNWTEWAATLGIVAFTALLISLAYRYLPLFPQERYLN